MQAAGRRPQPEKSIMKTVCFGEIMLRLSPPGFERFLQTPQFVATFGGGEANVAVSLATFGCESHYVTRLPGQCDRRGGGEGAPCRRACAPSTSCAAVSASASTTPSRRRASGRRQVIYDRRTVGDRGDDARDRRLGHRARPARSGSIAPASPPALGDNGAACAREALAAAKAAGATVSMDLNFRKKLWTEKKAQSVMRPLMEYVDVVIANEEDIQSVLGFEVHGTDVTTGRTQP